MNKPPFVSCIMPIKKDRLHKKTIALANFIRQDYGRKELIIVSDDQVVKSFRSLDKNIHQIFFNEKLTIGAARNKCIKYADGSIIMHLDDDDYYAPDWISKQVECLQVTGADICGLREVYFYNQQIGAAFKYTYPDRDGWVYGASMAYTRALWEQKPFDNAKHIGEDDAFIRNGIEKKLAVQPYIDGYIKIAHGNNTAPVYFQDMRPVDATFIDNILSK